MGNKELIFINEDLTQKNAQIYFECRQFVMEKHLQHLVMQWGNLYKKTLKFYARPMKILLLDNLKSKTALPWNDLKKFEIWRNWSKTRLLKERQLISLIYVP